MDTGTRSEREVADHRCAIGVPGPGDAATFARFFLIYNLFCNRYCSSPHIRPCSVVSIPCGFVCIGMDWNRF